MRKFSMLARHVIGLVALATAVMTFGTASMVTSTASGQKTSGGDMTVSTVTGTGPAGEAVTAEFVPEKFQGSKNGLTVTGDLVGTIGDQDFSQEVTFPVKSINGEALPTSNTPASDLNLVRTCDVLNLVLGPLDLNILGLQVDLNQVVLDITAVTGQGNLLGNLLCAVTSLLDGGGPLSNLLRQVGNLLNRILGQLSL